MQPQKPKKSFNHKVGIGCGVAAVLLVLIIGIAIASQGGSSPNTNTNSNTNSNANTQATSQPTSQPTTAPQVWTTTQTFTGSGIKKTAVFTAPSDWKILWSCDPNSFQGFQFNLIVTVNDQNAIPVDVAVNEICKPGNTSGETEEHQGGQVYLDVNSEGSWTLKVQELK